MNELARLRGSERYGACDDVVQDALFKGSPAGVLSTDSRSSAPQAPSESANSIF